MTVMRTRTCIFIFLAGLVFGALLSWGLGRRRVSTEEARVFTRTMYVRDTQKIFVPKLVAGSVKELDPVNVPVKDTVRLRDTLWMRLPRESRQYGDSTYRAQVSGFMPSLDWIEVFPVTKYVTTTKVVTDTRRFRMGLRTGAAVPLRGESNPVVYGGPEVSVRIDRKGRWQAGGGLDFVSGNPGSDWQVFAHASITYNIIP